MMKKVQLQKLPSNNSFSYTKGEGCGNTFIIFDYIDHEGVTLHELIPEAHRLLCEEGRDDALLLTLEKREGNSLIINMHVLEPDSSLADFCGNGARVTAKYLHAKYRDQYAYYYLHTKKGVRKIWWDEQSYFVSMGRTLFDQLGSQFVNVQLLSSNTMLLGVGARLFHFQYTETLEPHLVTFDLIDQEELVHIGTYINKYQREFFPLGININHAEVLSRTEMSVVTYERGVNRLTKACGTGATSSVMLGRALGFLDREEPIAVKMVGGNIVITPSGDESIMSGPATLEN